MASAAPAIPGYRVLRLLGEGGMGQVFLAEDEMLGRPVAVKTISPEVAGRGEVRARFLREARAMATVEHPRVVRVYSFGERESLAYFVMEYVEGEALAERLRRAPLGVEESVRIAGEVAEALEAAWRRGIVHRDVKPGNILLDREGHVHVADFGLARPTPLAGDSAEITREGVFVGSPHYVAPEQARAEQTDFRSDIYSLGVVLYEMLAGRRPFEGKTPTEVVAKQLHMAPPSLREFAPAAPEAVTDLVARMTAKDPRDRPASYAEVLSGLSGRMGATKTGLPTATMPSGAARRMARRRRWRWWAAGGVAAAAVATLGLPSRHPRPPGDLVVAIAPFYGPDAESAGEGRAFATLVGSEVTRRLGPDQASAIALVEAPDAVRGHGAARRVGSRLAADAVVWGEALSLRGETEIQPYVTAVGAPAASPPSFAAFVLDSTGSPIEQRRRNASRLADAVVRLAAERALARGEASEALALVEACDPSPAALRFKARALQALGRKAEADSALRAAGEAER
ncbi:MAG TPA: serine/threonine-protein kinase [Vicinamibacteria bacterium]|nr:serine/threonine-protein kinase [Vicinamibacteria bacterium]